MKTKTLINGLLMVITSLKNSAMNQKLMEKLKLKRVSVFTLYRVCSYLRTRKARRNLSLLKALPIGCGHQTVT